MVKQMGEYQSMDALYKIYFEMFRPSSKWPVVYSLIHDKRKFKFFYMFDM